MKINFSLSAYTGLCCLISVLLLVVESGCSTMSVQSPTTTPQQATQTATLQPQPNATIQIVSAVLTKTTTSSSHVLSTPTPQPSQGTSAATSDGVASALPSSSATIGNSLEVAQKIIKSFPVQIGQFKLDPSQTYIGKNRITTAYVDGVVGDYLISAGQHIKVVVLFPKIADAITLLKILRSAAIGSVYPINIGDEAYVAPDNTSNSTDGNGTLAVVRLRNAVIEIIPEPPALNPHLSKDDLTQLLEGVLVIIPN